MKTLIEGAAEFGFELTGEQLARFEKYTELLLEWNEKFNLTAITDREEIQIKHFLDSVSLLLAEPPKNSSLIDIGAGAGFPSIPVKIVRPDLRITMLDSLNKRVDFLNNVVSSLGLTEITAVHSRAEDGARTSLRESFDYAAARAVANLSVLAEYALPFVRVGGYFLAMKGTAPQEEIENAQAAVKLLGGRVEETREINIAQGRLRHSLIIIKKIARTPSNFPRKAGRPAKEPIK